jgi:hypothetical protein
MEDQLTVRLPRDLSKALADASRRMDRKSAEIVRMALREFLGVGTAKRRPAEGARALIGSLESGRPDLTERQRENILESIRRGR